MLLIGHALDLCCDIAELFTGVEETAFDAIATHQHRKLLEFGWIGVFVDAVNGWEHTLTQAFSYALISCEHEFFNHGVSLITLFQFDTCGVSLIIEHNIELGHLKVKSSFGKAFLAEQGSELASNAKHCVYFLVADAAATLHLIESLLVSQTLA